MKKTILLGSTAALAAALVVPALASANVSVVCSPSNPNNVEVITSGHPAGQAINVSLFGNDVELNRRVLQDDGVFSFPVDEDVRVYATTTQYGYSFSSVPFVKDCIPPVVHPKTPVVITPTEPKPVQPKPVKPKPKKPVVKKVPVIKGSLVKWMPNHTTFTRTYFGRFTVRNTGQVPATYKIKDRFGPLVYGFTTEGKITRFKTWKVTLKPGGVANLKFRFGHPPAAWKKYVKNCAGLYDKDGNLLDRSCIRIFEG